ncbi:hypothetical protein ACIO13_07920 [Streptomyces sp. NPDC087425]
MSFRQAVSGIDSGVRTSKGMSRGTTAMTDSASARIISRSTLV